MCGIAGILSGDACAPGAVRAMTRSLVHRGPDGEGFFSDEDVALGMRRLAIVDVASGQQPQANETGTVWIVFNGEIYNHADLRAELVQRGHVFRTSSDTEAIVHGYEQWGIEGCLNRLRGMFAFLLWDAARRELFVARDRLGIKPLYYTQIDRQWRFASEIKALLACDDVPRAVNTDAIGPYLLHQYVPAPATFFAGIHKLLPGHYMHLSTDGKATTRPFWRLSFDPVVPVPSFKEAAEQVRTRMTEAVRLRLMSDVPLGCLLSGGLDSSIVAAIMARSSQQRVRTFTVGFPEMPDMDERRHARLVAEHYRTAHTELDVELDATQLLEHIVYHLDEPLADAAALPTYIICKAAREHVTVLLTGEGSDEVFAGYPRYALSRVADVFQRVPRRVRHAALGALGSVLNSGRAGHAVRRLADAPDDPVARNVLWTGVFSPTEIAQLWHTARTKAQPEADDWPYAEDHPPDDSLNRLLYRDLRRWLVDDVLMKVDKLSMAASVEARVPFLDHELVEYVASLPPSYKLRHGHGKAVLRQAFRDWIPPQTMARRKAAFRPPLDVWFRGQLGKLAAERLRAPGSFCRTFLDPRAVERVLADHVTCAANNGQRLWTLLCAELWYGQWFGREHSFPRPLEPVDFGNRASTSSARAVGLSISKENSAHPERSNQRERRLGEAMNRRVEEIPRSLCSLPPLAKGAVAPRPGDFEMAQVASDQPGHGQLVEGCGSPAPAVSQRPPVSVSPRPHGGLPLRSVLVVPDLPTENWRSMNRYAEGLLSQLAALERDYVVATPPLNERNGHRRLDGARRYWNRLVAYPTNLKAYRPDVVHVLDHSYAHVLSAFPAGRSLVTVHDLWPLRRPRQDGSLRQLVLDALARRMTNGMRAATLLCADSAFSAREAQELLGIPVERLRVVHLGVEEAFFESLPAAEVRVFARASFGNSGPRLLHVSSCVPRKNIDGLLRIVAEVRRALPGARLLQVGGTFTNAQRALIETLGLSDSVVQRSGLSDGELRVAYRAADVLILPSFYEGFGFPVLEAQASGLPVLCSNRASLPEVAGAGAVVLDPDCPADWTPAVIAMMKNQNHRQQLIDSGLANARLHTWQRTADHMAAIYAELLDA